MDHESGQRRSLLPEVMVSYSSFDRPQVLQIVQRLRAAGVAAWIDQGGIDGAQKWGEEIVNAIDACKTVVLMVSRYSMESENIGKEVMLAWESGKKFLPLCLDDTRIPKSMQYQLAGIQQIKLYEGDSEEKFTAVLRSLMRLQVHVSPYHVALIYAGSGDPDEAFNWLNRACGERSGGLAHLETEPRFSGLKTDPRFQPLLNRVKTLTLQPEDAAANLPLVLPKTQVRAAPTGPVPWWKKFFWPDIYDDRSARHAAALGVFASALLVASALLLTLSTFLVNNPALGFGVGATATYAIFMFVPVGIGIQKMGRPAAIIGLVLCAMGTMTNMNMLTAMQAATAAYSNLPGQQNIYLVPYLYAWVGFLVSLVAVVGLTHATRGTLAYHQMVMNREARDKQDAINAEEFVAIKATVFGFMSRSRSQMNTLRAAAESVAARTTAPSAKAHSVRPAVTSVQSVAEIPAEVVTPAPVIALLAEPLLPQTLPSVITGPSFAEVIGVQGRMRWFSAASFLLANLLAGLTYLAFLAATGKTQIHPVYWQAVFYERVLLALAASLSFRFLKNFWLAALVAAALAAVVELPAYAQLPSFQAWGDLVYREPFQQFVLLPFCYGFFFLAGLALAVPRVKPLPLGLWLGAMAAEVLTPVVANLLQVFGSGKPPDALLAGTSVVFAVLRSLVFAGVLWALLELLRKLRPEWGLARRA